MYCIVKVKKYSEDNCRGFLYTELVRDLDISPQIDALNTLAKKQVNAFPFSKLLSKTGFQQSSLACMRYM